jgi:hypothetical protein
MAAAANLMDRSIEKIEQGVPSGASRVVAAPAIARRTDLHARADAIAATAAACTEEGEDGDKLEEARLDGRSDQVDLTNATERTETGDTAATSAARRTIQVLVLPESLDTVSSLFIETIQEDAVLLWSRDVPPVVLAMR